MGSEIFYRKDVGKRKDFDSTKERKVRGTIWKVFNNKRQMFRESV